MNNVSLNQNGTYDLKSGVTVTRRIIKPNLALRVSVTLNQTSSEITKRPKKGTSLNIFNRKIKKSNPQNCPRNKCRKSIKICDTCENRTCHIYIHNIHLYILFCSMLLFLIFSNNIAITNCLELIRLSHCRAKIWSNWIKCSTYINYYLYLWMVNSAYLPLHLYQLMRMLELVFSQKNFSKITPISRACNCHHWTFGLFLQ